MAKQYSKKTISDIFKQKAQAKGFQIRVTKGEGKGIANITPTLVDMIDAFAEGMEDILQSGDKSADLVAKSFKIGPAGQQQPVATKAGPGQTNVVADMTTDPGFFTWMETLHSLLQAPYPEPGNGSPSVFAIALKALISLKPTSIKAKISEGSSKVKVTT